MKAKTLCIAIGVLMLVGVFIAPTYALINPVPRYVIITTKEIAYYSNELQNFIDMKKHQGFRVTVVTEDDFDNLAGQPPHGRAEKIRQWLINKYEELNIKYVLLIGDPDPDDPTNPTDKVGDIPMKMCWKNYSKWYDREDPTDYFYADLNSDWNADEDEFFCERHPWNASERPHPTLIGPDHFWIEWTGRLKINTPGKYKISTLSDGGVLVMIDGTPVICDACWINPPPSPEHHPKFEDRMIELNPGPHDIQIIYKEQTGDAFIKLL